MSFRRFACSLTGILLMLPALASRASAQLPPGIVPGIVFVANGSGDSVRASDNLNDVVQHTRAPLQVYAFRWSLGEGIGPDLKDRVNQRIMGWCLARQVMAYRQAHPYNRVILMGHSAGTAVVLAAAEYLPAETVDRIFLMAPAVSPFYNLRPALRASKEGMDVYFSSNDSVLDTFIPICGTADGLYNCKAAGQVGFSRMAVGMDDPMLAAKLYQHPWCPDYEKALNCGGHSGSIRCCFLSRYVLPLIVFPAMGMLPPPPPPVAVVVPAPADAGPPLLPPAPTPPPPLSK